MAAIASPVERSADPERARTVLARLIEVRPDLRDRLADDDPLTRAVVTVGAASGWLGRLVVTDRGAIDVLADLDVRASSDIGAPAELAPWRARELLRIAARDLLGLDGVERTTALLSAMATDLLVAAARLARAEDMAVVAMGKLGGGELNYSSDVDVVIVGRTSSGSEQVFARRFLQVARTALRIDVDLRPEGRDGGLVRTVEGYRAYWSRWAAAWESQALLKARPVAGDPDLGVEFTAAADEHLWTRPFAADDLRAVRAMKDRTERQATERGDGGREVKRTPGGLRDVEFSTQLLQLVHGQHDPALRVRATMPALVALADGGYVDEGDARWLGQAYRFLRRVEHAAQLDEDRQAHVVPAGRDARARMARVLGFADTPARGALDAFDAELAACRATVRSLHERLYFRPLLEAFAGVDGPLDTAAATRLAAFGFSDGERTRQAVTELTRGLTRSSRLMAQVMPLLLDWLSTSPDPDAGLLGLRQLASGPTRTLALARAFRDSPETARRLCTLVGTSAIMTSVLAREPDLIEDLGRSDRLETRAVAELRGPMDHAMARHRDDEVAARRGLRRVVDRERVRVAAHDVWGLADADEVASALTRVAQAALDASVDRIAPGVAFAVLALGRLGGSDLAYASDLDLVLVHAGAGPADHDEGERAASALRRFVHGAAPAEQVFAVDLDLRPEGRSGPLARSVEAMRTYFSRWAAPWERLAMSRVRPVAGDLDLGARAVEAIASHVWGPLSDVDRREIRRIKARTEAERIPVGQDPQFHLKLGPGALADVELTVALLLLEAGIREPSTRRGLAALDDADLLAPGEVKSLRDAHAFCEATRNRLTLVAGARSDALPGGDDLGRLARSLDTTGADLRDEYRRLTRRARRVVESRFYGR